MERLAEDRHIDCAKRLAEDRQIECVKSLAEDRHIECAWRSALKNEYRSDRIFSIIPRLFRPFLRHVHLSCDSGMSVRPAIQTRPILHLSQVCLSSMSDTLIECPECLENVLRVMENAAHNTNRDVLVYLLINWFERAFSFFTP